MRAVASSCLLVVFVGLVVACGGDDASNDPTPDAMDVDPDAIPPDAPPPEVCDNDLDDDGDHVVDCGDPDCQLEVYCQPEMMCNDGEDNDLDGNADCDDTDCALAPNCLPEGQCANGTDDDLDGLADCDDADCATACLVGCGDGENLVALDATGLPAVIPDNGSLPIDFAVTAEGWITSAATRFTITHTFDGDLDLSLTTPAGTSLDLSSDNGGSGEGYTDTVLVDSATTSVVDGTAPFTGEFQPEQPFSTVRGAAAAGTWTFTIRDDAGSDTGNAHAVALYLCVCNGTDGCEAGLACQDGEDNDGDTLVDCADVDDCGGVLQCQPEVCDDGQDNNGNGLVDCADPECASGVLCTAEADCDDGTDDDGDGRADCADPGCDGVGACELGAEATCTDGLDNDADGAIDCADSDCANAFACAMGACPAGTTPRVYTSADVPLALADNTTVVSDLDVADAGLVASVAVQVDIDHTYTSDLDIRLLAPGGARELSTDNGGSGENYTATVFVDSATTAITAGTPPFTGQFQPEQPLGVLAGRPLQGEWDLEVGDDAGGDTGTVVGFAVAVCACDAGSGECEFGLACRNGTDDDGDGLVDCAESACATDPFCIPESNCANGADEDLDGDIDCADADCDGVGTCEFGVETTCTDGLDNDADTTIDCFDADCGTHPACQAELDCNDGLDDDGDGAIDCADSDCDVDLGCMTESDCTDGVDNDGDGNTDCIDVGCDGVQGCELGGEVTCDDGFDNDGDGNADCADTQCAGGIVCAGITCPAGSTATVYAASGVPLAIPDNAPNGPAVVSISVPTGGLVTLAAAQVDIAHPNDGDLDIYLAAPGGTRELSTDNGSTGDHYTDAIFLDAAATAITAGTAPFTGQFRPEQPLAPLAGTASAGTWSLRVGDDASSNTGQVLGFELLVCACDPSGGQCEFGAACRNGTDDDGDGLVDCDEADCAADPYCIPRERVCDDGVDDDGDTMTDCADPECAWVCTVLGPTCATENTLLALPTPDVPQTLPGAITTLNATIQVPFTGTIVESAVRFNATHSFTADLDLTMTSPGGIARDLTSDNGSSGDNYVDTVFVDSATNLITAGTAPFTGSFDPEQPLSAWYAQPVGGVWTITLADDAAGDGGSWTELTLGACVAP